MSEIPFASNQRLKAFDQRTGDLVPISEAAKLLEMPYNSLHGMGKYTDILVQKNVERTTCILFNAGLRSRVIKYKPVPYKPRKNGVKTKPKSAPKGMDSIDAIREALEAVDKTKAALIQAEKLVRRFKDLEEKLRAILSES